MAGATFSAASNDDNNRASIRESYLQFPAWTQPFWTLLTGKSLPNELPLLRAQPVVFMVLSFTAAVFICGIHLRMLSSIDSMTRFLGYALTPLVALYLTGILRKAQVVYGHHAIHGTLFKGRKRLNRFAAMILTILSFSQNEKEYERDHLDHHRRSIFTTLRDADAALLYAFGLCPGKTINELHRNLLFTLISPRYHLVLMRTRLISNFSRPPAGLVLVVAWIVFVFAIIPSLFGVVAACLALWLPMTVLYQMSALLQFTTEHVWLIGSALGADSHAYAERCHGRFCGERVPGSGDTPASLYKWIRWWVRTACFHMPMRLAVLVGDLPAHDWHHVVPMIGHNYAEWPNAIYQRQHAIDSGNSAGMEQRELWGIDNMIQYVLLSMALAPPLTDIESEAQHEITVTNSS